MLGDSSADTSDVSSSSDFPYCLSSGSLVVIAFEFCFLRCCRFQTQNMRTAIPRRTAKRAKARPTPSAQVSLDVVAGIVFSKRVGARFRFQGAVENAAAHPMTVLNFGTNQESDIQNV